MPAVTKNLTIEQKATFRKKMVYRDKFKKPINLTGFSARMQIRAGMLDTVEQVVRQADRSGAGQGQGPHGLHLHPRGQRGAANWSCCSGSVESNA